MFNSIRSFNVSTSSISGQDIICFKDFSNVEVILEVTRLSKLYLFQIAGYCLWNLSFGKAYTIVNIQDDVLYLKVSEIEREFNVSHQAIIAADLSNTLHDVLGEALKVLSIAKNRFQLQKARREGMTLQEFYDLEEISLKLKIPIHELVHAKIKGTLDELILKERKLHHKINAVSARINILYEDSVFFAPGSNILNFIKLSKQDLVSIKETVRIAFKILASDTCVAQKEVEAIIPVAENIFILAKSSKKSLEVTGLFGKKIGSGSYSNIIHCVDLIKGCFRTDENSVLKIPDKGDGLLQIHNEVKVLKKLHENGLPFAIQKPLKLLKYRKKILGAIGTPYLYDLETYLKQKNLTIDKKLKFSSQLIQAVCNLHKIDLIHGDIKATNVLIDSKDNDLLYLADFGGSQVLDETVRVLYSGIHTPSYRRYEDAIWSERFCKQQDVTKYREIEKKCDIFALAALIFKIFTNRLPYILPKKYKDDLDVFDDACDQLKKHVSQKFAEILTSALDNDYTKRPSALTMLEAINEP